MGGGVRFALPCLRQLLCHSPLRRHTLFAYPGHLHSLGAAFERPGRGRCWLRIRLVLASFASLARAAGSWRLPRVGSVVEKLALPVRSAVPLQNASAPEQIASARRSACIFICLYLKFELLKDN